MTPNDGFGFKGLGTGKEIDVLSWVSTAAPLGSEIIDHIKGLKWEVKDAKGGIGELSIKAVEFLDASKQPIDPVKLTGIVISDTPASSSSVNPGSSSSGPDAIFAAPALSNVKVFASGMQVQVEGAAFGSDIVVFNMQGKVIASSKVFGATMGINVPSKGTYLVRAGGKIHTVSVK